MSVRLPRFFVPQSETLAPLAPLDETCWPDHVIDAFYLEGNREWVATVCSDAGLRLLPVDGNLPDNVKEQLAAYEVAGGQVRRMNLNELFLLAVRYFDRSQGNGFARPVKLSGTLFGPFGPAHAARDVHQVDGELLISQAELLDAISTDAAAAFRYPALRDTRMFHLTLAGDHEDELRGGLGVILAYPLLPPELCIDGPANQAMIRTNLLEVLVGIQGEPDKGFNPKAELSKWLTSFTGRKVNLTTQNTLEEGIQLAQQSLKSLSDWPSPRVTAMRQRLASKPAPPPPPPVSPATPKIPRPPEPTYKAVDFDARPDLSKTPKGNPEWMNDFGSSSSPIPRASHTPKPSAPKPQPKPSTPKPKSDGTPDWMKDFQ